MSQEMEHEHLQLAVRHISEGRERVAQQRARIQKLELDGHDTSQSRELLAVLEQTLKLMIAHRDMILRELGQGTLR
jgi:hypothetical protein